MSGLRCRPCTNPSNREVMKVILVVVFKFIKHHHGQIFEYSAISCCRTHTASLTDFGGVGDGVTSNTKAFQAAINHLGQVGSNGGGSLLYVPPGKWSTGSFNLTSYFTLFLHQDAVLLATQDENEWAVIDPLPSYGRG
ncbi:probable polygalacturonase [Tanacetum coccineum]